MNGKVIAVIIVFVTNLKPCQSFRYDNFAMYTSIPHEKEHLRFFQNLEKQKYIDMVFLRRPSKLYQGVQFVVNPKDINLFLERVGHFGVTVDELHSNVQELFDAQRAVHRYLRFKTDTYTWNQYHDLADVNQWLADIAVEFPKICELIPVGKSVQNRDIYALSIVRKDTKGTVIVEAGMHGNEWISTEFVTYLANQLIHANLSTDNRLKVVANHYEWFLVPVANPDGYDYTHVVDRLWRKNRSPNGEHFGVDLNRNFDYSFGIKGHQFAAKDNLIQFDSSHNPADDNYCGPRPFSEPETLAFSKFITKKANKNLKYYFSIHAYGQKIMIPYGDTILHVDNFGTTENFGKQAMIKMYKMYGTKYDIGTTYDTLGQKISGTSTSWVKSSFNVPFVYTFLLRDDGQKAHGLPPEEILPTCQETMTGLLEIMTTEYKRLRADIYSESAAYHRTRLSKILLLCLILFWYQ